MIKVTKEQTDEIVLFLKEIKEKQDLFNDTEDICYPIVSLYMAAKKKIFFSNLLLHPLILSNGPFYEEKKKIKENELEQLLNDVIVYELTQNDEKLSIPERTKIIQVHKSLKLKREKNEKLTAL